MTATVNGAAQAPFDLDAAVAASRNEAQAKPFIFSARGEQYSIPATIDWPIEVSVAFAEVAADPDSPHAAVAAMRGLATLLGEEQWARLGKLSQSYLEALFNQISASQGLSTPDFSRPPLPVSTPT